MTGNLFGNPNPKKATKPKDHQRIFFAHRSAQAADMEHEATQDSEIREWETLTLRERLLTRRQQERRKAIA